MLVVLAKDCIYWEKIFCYREINIVHFEKQNINFFSDKLQFFHSFQTGGHFVNDVIRNLLVKTIMTWKWAQFIDFSLAILPWLCRQMS